MAETYRRLAKTIACPKTKSALARIVDSDLEVIEETLCRVLRKAMREWAGDRDIRFFGPKHFGSDNFTKIYFENKLPCLKNTLKVANKLNLELVLKNYPFAEAGAVPWRDYKFEAEFEYAEFMAFLYNLTMYRSARGDTKEMKEERERILSNLSNPEFPLYWSTLIRFIAACGYQANFYLNKKSVLDGCLTPGQDRRPNPQRAAEMPKAKNTLTAEEQETLHRRLHYSV